MNRQERRAAERLQLKQERKDHREENTVPVAAAISEARLEANRTNAQRSTGPKTEEGKANSAQNSFKHGLYSKQLVLKGEDPAQLDALKTDLRAEHQPATLTEEILVNEMAEHYWRLRRARIFETKFLSEGSSTNQMNTVARVMSSAERGFHKSLKTLRELQKHRGFVPQTIPVSIGRAANAGSAPPQAAATRAKSEAAGGANAGSVPRVPSTKSAADADWDEFEASMAAACPEVAAQIAAEQALEEEARKLAATR